MTRGFRFTLVWLFGSFVAVLMALNTVGGSLIDGVYTPQGNDSFYHARRILDTVKDPSAFYEFDERIHAPEGSWLTWPWAYDYVVAYVVRGIVATGLVSDPMTALAYVPVAATVLSIALIVGIALALEFSAVTALFACLCVALSALTQIIHGVGIVDHHYAEYIFALAALWSGLSWLKDPSSKLRASLAALILGIAPAFQNGLFILQLPLVASIGLLWLRDNRLPRNSATAFAVALLTSSLLVLLPSQPFRQGQFTFYLLSWFHLYIAGCTAVTILFMTYCRRSARNLGILAGGAVIALLIISAQLTLGGNFLAGKLDALPTIVEVRSVFSLLRTQGFIRVSGYYSLLILLAPATIAGCLWYLLRRQARPQYVLLCVFSVIGLLMLLLQFRLHVFGSFALFVPGLLVADRMLIKNSRPIVGACAIGSILAISYFLPVRDQLFAKRVPGNDFYYFLTRDIYPAMSEACRLRPGIVLAGTDNGHYIRFHTECSVIGNNFLLTPQHTAKFHEVGRLMHMTPAQLLVADVPVKYVLVTLSDIASERQRSSAFVVDSPEKLRDIQPPLVGMLLFAPPQFLDHRYRLIKEIRMKDSVPVARLYEILPRAPGVAQGS